MENDRAKKLMTDVVITKKYIDTSTDNRNTYLDNKLQRTTIHVNNDQDLTKIEKKSKKTKKWYHDSTIIFEHSISVFKSIVETHQHYMRFLQDCRMLTPDHTYTIMRKIEILDVIVNRKQYTEALKASENDIFDNNYNICQSEK